MSKVYTTSTFHASKFTLGTYTRFEYDGVIREGVVNKISQDYLILELLHDKDGRRYKSFRYEKMETPLSFTVNA